MKSWHFDVASAAQPETISDRTMMNVHSVDGITGKDCRFPAPQRTARIAVRLLMGTALTTLLLASSSFLWRLLTAAGDAAGASMLFAVCAVVFGVWLAHWLGLILLNTVALTSQDPIGHERAR
jgi:hypothetical protein